MTISRIVRTKIIPPPRNARTLPRPRVSQILAGALEYRLTILQAGAGYGKSTALAELSREIQPFVWYQVDAEDNDPLVFLLHLFHATKQALPNLPDLPITYLEGWDGSKGSLPWRGLLDQFINILSTSLSGPALLVLDDIHQVTESGEIPLILNRLVGLTPPYLHIVLSGRPPIQLPDLSRWRAQGHVLTLDQSVLTFTAAEISVLFAQHYGLELTDEEIDSLLAYTEGWAIALHLIWQSLRSRSSSTYEFPPSWQAGSLGALFDILAGQVFEQQPADIRDFLLVTSTLRDLLPEACDALRKMTGYSSGDSAAMLSYLRRQELFVVETAGGTLRYHHIFHNFLRQQSEPEKQRQWHRLAADYFLSHNNHEAVIFHLLEARAWNEVANLLDTFGAILLTAGQLDTLASYIDSLPPITLNFHPFLLFYLGELARLHSRFDEAHGWYKQAETIWRARGQLDGVARALRGQARVYIDTVNPIKAEQLLEQAIRLSDGFEDREAQVRLFELLSENKLNSGHVDDAERLRQRAESLRIEGPSNDLLLFRVWLRTGRFEEARCGLEERAEAEKKVPVQTPRAHRETMLLLSFIYSIQGEPERAYQAALEGTRRGEALNSPFVTAVGYMRQGHALILTGEGAIRNENIIHACQQFEKSKEISRTLGVPRLLVEADWGLCRAYGYQGDIAQAHTYAQEAIEIATQAGDEWIASLTRLTMGASLTLAARYEAAEEWLNRAIIGFQECSDTFGCTVARLWLCMGWFKQKQATRSERILQEVMTACLKNGYDFLFLRPSLVGAHDERLFTPLLVHAYRTGCESAYAVHLLEAIGLPHVKFHPGYRLRVQTLGSFQVWRGDEVIPVNGWRREKAKHLFQLLLTFRETPLERDQIYEHLWANLDPATAQRNFKITLNALYQALEPKRDPGSESAYILREGLIYSLRPGADLWIDAQAFTSYLRDAEGCQKSNPAQARVWLQKALDLYQGEFLPDARYETWPAAEREHLAVLFLNAADHYCDLCLSENNLEEVISTCGRILANDNCWERAYRYLMLAYHHMGNRGQIARTYQRCSETLQKELDVFPAPETDALYKQLTLND